MLETYHTSEKLYKYMNQGTHYTADMLTSDAQSKGSIHSCTHRVNTYSAHVHVSYLLSFLKDPEERSGGSQVQYVRSNSHAMIHETSNLTKQCADKLGSWGDVDPQQSLDCQGVCLLIAHHGYIVQPVKVRQALEGREEIGGRM